MLILGNMGVADLTTRSVKTLLTITMVITIAVEQVQLSLFITTNTTVNKYLY